MLPCDLFSDGYRRKRWKVFRDIVNRYVLKAEGNEERFKPEKQTQIEKGEYLGLEDDAASGSGRGQADWYRSIANDRYRNPVLAFSSIAKVQCDDYPHWSIRFQIPGLRAKGERWFFPFLETILK